MAEQDDKNVEDRTERAARKSRIGLVLSNKMTKTVVVRVERRVSNRLYGKITTQTKKYKVHDENQICRPGDRVRIVETRPLSKEKRWRVVETIRQGSEA